MCLAAHVLEFLRWTPGSVKLLLPPRQSRGASYVRLADIAGGPVKAAHKSFSHLLPDAQGNIRVLFAPTENYAAINALELIDEGPTTRLH